MLGPMDTKEPTSHRASQLQLPLTGAAELPEQPAEARPTAEWRLDERTRLIGRRGVAAARALLAEHSPTDRSGTHPRGSKRAA
jgi:hypothetical protein